MLNLEATQQTPGEWMMEKSSLSGICLSEKNEDPMNIAGGHNYEQNLSAILGNWKNLEEPKMIFKRKLAIYTVRIMLYFANFCMICIKFDTCFIIRIKKQQ